MAEVSPAELARLRVVHQVPGMERVEVRRDLVYRELEGAAMTMDVYLPGRARAGRRAPVVLLVHGGPVPPRAYPLMKRMGIFVSWGEMLAASGMAAVAFNHLHRGWHDLAESADNVVAVLASLRDRADALGIDAERVCLWAFSGGAPQLAPWLAAPDPAVRCLVGYYPLLDLRGDLGPISGLLAEMPASATLERFSPAAACSAAAEPPGRPRPPLLLARAGRDEPYMLRAFDAFLAAALAGGLELELLNHALGRHSFDILDPGPRSSWICARTLDFVAGCLS